MSIIQLYRSKPQPDASTTAVLTTGSEMWIAITDEFTRPIALNKLLKDLGEGNEFDFPAIGETHPDDDALIMMGWSVGKAIDETYTEYKVTTDYSNDSSSINDSVSPSKAQDKYSVSHVNFEDVISITKGVSRKKKSSTGEGAGDNEAIQNTNDVGIIVAETKTITRVVITRNESSYDLKEASVHVGKVNSSPVQLLGKTFDEGQCKLLEWAGEDAYDSEGMLYWRVTYEILVSDDNTFFEREFIMRGTVNKKGRSTSQAAVGYTKDVETKLQADGSFFTKEDQGTASKFYSISFVTIEETNWGPAVRLGALPNENIITLAHDDGFGLIDAGTTLRP
jgi:hypothetical protein